MDNKVKIDTASIPDGVYDAMCRLISKHIRTFYNEPKNRKGYEEWMKTPEGQRANLTKEERDAFDAAMKGENV